MYTEEYVKYLALKDLLKCRQDKKDQFQSRIVFENGNISDYFIDVPFLERIISELQEKMIIDNGLKSYLK